MEGPKFGTMKLYKILQKFHFSNLVKSLSLSEAVWANVDPTTVRMRHVGWSGHFAGFREVLLINYETLLWFRQIEKKKTNLKG